MVKFKFTDTLHDFISIYFKLGLNQIQNVRIGSNFFNLSINKIRIGCLNFYDKCTFLKLLNTCSFTIIDENLSEDFFHVFWEKTLHFVIHLHDVSLCILHRRSIKRQLACDHGVQTDSQTPHVDLFRVVFLSSGQFRSCVRRWPAESAAETTIFLFGHETEVDEFGVPVSVEEDVFALDVPMENPLWFQVLEGWQNLFENLGSEPLRKRSIVIDEVEKFPVLAQFHENVHFFVVLEELINSGDVGVEKSFMDVDLKSRFFNLFCWHFGFVEDFDCDCLSGGFVDGFVHFGVRTHSDFFLWNKIKFTDQVIGNLFGTNWSESVPESFVHKKGTELKLLKIWYFLHLLISNLL